jgi:vacuolar iron transporter family protein
MLRARPLQAALASAGSFAIGAAVPLVIAAIAPRPAIVPAVTLTALACLAALGGMAARTGGAPLVAGIVRVVFWGALAMALTAAVGSLFGTAV